MCELTIELCARLLVDINQEKDPDAARRKLVTILDSGRAYEQFGRMVAAQAGRLNELPELGTTSEQRSPQSGYLQAMHGQRLGHAVIALGGGRSFVGQEIDPIVGLEMLVRVGDHIEKGQPLVRVFSGSHSDQESAKSCSRSFPNWRYSAGPSPTLQSFIEFIMNQPEYLPRLLEAARQAATAAYTPYSQFPVGAAILSALERSLPDVTSKTVRSG